MRPSKPDRQYKPGQTHYGVSRRLRKPDGTKFLGRTREDGNGQIFDLPIDYGIVIEAKAKSDPDLYEKAMGEIRGAFDLDEVEVSD